MDPKLGAGYLTGFPIFTQAITEQCGTENWHRPAIGLNINFVHDNFVAEDTGIYSVSSFFMIFLGKYVY